MSFFGIGKSKPKKKSFQVQKESNSLNEKTFEEKVEQQDGLERQVAEDDKKYNFK